MRVAGCRALHRQGQRQLRNIYTMAPGATLPSPSWRSRNGAQPGIACPKTMAKTIRKRMEGLLTYWNHGCLTSASQKGFNNEIGWLTQQAYGYRDERYLHLKIYDLPNLSTRRDF